MLQKPFKILKPICFALLLLLLFFQCFVFITKYRKYDKEEEFVGAKSFVFFGQEMGGRQSERLITSDGKCFPRPIVTTSPVQDHLSALLYLQRQVCGLVSPHICDSLTSNVLSILLSSPQ